MVTMIDNNPRALVIPGCDDIALKPKDFTSERAWQRLCLGYSLDPEDFKDINLYKAYFYAIPKLTEGVVTVGGYEGSGKSQWMYYTGYHMRELFNKQSTYDIPPKETYGYYRQIDDASFLEELDKFKDIALIQKAVEKQELPQERLTEALNDVKLYNCVIGLDEAYDKLEKLRQTNFAINIGHLIRKYRHFHILFILVTPDLRDINRRQAFDRRTHEVHCSKDDFTGLCKYRIWWRRPNMWFHQTLDPAKWSFLWETHNIIGGTVLPIKGLNYKKEVAS